VIYLDNRDGNREKSQPGDVALSRQTDNAYKDATGPVEIVDPLLRRVLRTEKQGSASTIVWNPWSDGASSMADLGGDEWPRMICAEGGNILMSAVSLKAWESHTMTITIRVAGAS